MEQRNSRAVTNKIDAAGYLVSTKYAGVLDQTAIRVSGHFAVRIDWRNAL